MPAELASTLPAPERGIRTRSLVDGFLLSAARFPTRPALEAGGQTLSYSELFERSAAVAATLTAEAPTMPRPLTASFAYRTPSAFVGVLGALLAGNGYVPLNPRFPIARNREILRRTGCRTMIVGADAAPQLKELLDGIDKPIVVVLDGTSAVLPGAIETHHRVFAGAGLRQAAEWQPPVVHPGALAYVLFTSGSTGRPKGVMISHRNVLHYIDALSARYGIDEHDRFSQMAELTFDNSVLDMFLAWEHGACVCCPTGKELIKPGGFITRAGLTVWFSVPSTAIIMRRLGMLKPDSYPTIRWSLFAGEALPAEVATAWLSAAPGSRLENLYGPTEVTVDCLLYRFDPRSSLGECEQGIVPIGRPLQDMQLLIADQRLREVAPGETGELLVAGPQVGCGYWRDPKLTERAFVVPPGRRQVHYRTGDLVRRPAVPGGPVTYLGRLDHQIKVRGVRIELGEVEAALRLQTGVAAVVAVGWPVTATGADGIVAFIGDTSIDTRATLAGLRRRLPAQMVPRTIRTMPELPLNVNGKFDRNALIATLEER
ncbi:MAG TPA: amino acid adenylation domain-containing protein [Solirubrobacteraceae bacterium]|nr:amino acid adenylation domain-containing protein [Solirubrobacteraceae bacterium]